MPGVDLYRLELRLLKPPATAVAALALVNEVTATVVAAPDARSEPLRVLRQALGFAWSVVIVSTPMEGKARCAVWARPADPDIRWIVRENLKKARLERLDLRVPEGCFPTVIPA